MPLNLPFEVWVMLITASLLFVSPVLFVLVMSRIVSRL